MHGEPKTAKRKTKQRVRAVAWTIADELAFVDCIGRRRDLLLRYGEAIRRRTDWIGMDRDLVMERIWQLVQRLDAKRAA